MDRMYGGKGERYPGFAGCVRCFQYCLLSRKFFECSVLECFEFQSGLACCREDGKFSIQKCNTINARIKNMNTRREKLLRAFLPEVNSRFLPLWCTADITVEEYTNSILFTAIDTRV